MFRGKVGKVTEATKAQTLLIFDDIADAITADALLRVAGYEVSLVAPPFHVRAGCDLAVTLPEERHLDAIGLLMASDIRVRGVLSDQGGSTPLTEVVAFVDFGAWLMVRAGNMKMTVERVSGLIVNVSGGGCPDIPYLSDQLVGLTLEQAPRPRELGDTICGLMLDRAFVEASESLGKTLR